jgi:hypothetical protein
MKDEAVVSALSCRRPAIVLIEVFSDLAPVDQIAVRDADELRVGAKVNVKQQGGK